MTHASPFSTSTLQDLFQRYKEHLKARCFDPYNRALSIRESWRIPKSTFWECECILTLFQSGVATKPILKNVFINYIQNKVVQLPNSTIVKGNYIFD
jgi:hypothetical protein